MVFKVENRKGKAYKDGITNLEAVTLHFNNLLSSLKDYSISSVGSDDFDF